MKLNTADRQCGTGGRTRSIAESGRRSVLGLTARRWSLVSIEGIVEGLGIGFHRIITLPATICMEMINDLPLSLQD